MVLRVLTIVSHSLGQSLFLDGQHMGGCMLCGTSCKFLDVDCCTPAPRRISHLNLILSVLQEGGVIRWLCRMVGREVGGSV